MISVRPRATLEELIVEHGQGHHAEISAKMGNPGPPPGLLSFSSHGKLSSHFTSMRLIFLT